jgi:aspartate kinase
VDFEATERLCAEKVPPLFREADVVVGGGFIAGTEIKGQLVTTTLGRGGSDYSAAILGAAVGAGKVEIWTDVDGILTTDPRVVPEARRILKLNYEEAAELAYFGAKVLHPATIHPAVRKNIPVWVLNSRNPNSSGTVITDVTSAEESVVKAIACKRNVTLINIHSSRMLGAAGFLQSVFDAFGQEKVSIDLISTSEVNVSLTLDPQSDRASVQRVLARLEKIATVTAEEGMASVATVGSGIRRVSGVAARAFGALKGINVVMISMGSSEINLSFVVKDSEVAEVMRKLHAEFFGGTLNPALFAPLA